MEGRIKNLLWFIFLISIIFVGAFYINYQKEELKKWENFGESFYYDELVTTPSNMTYENLGFKGVLFHYGKEDNSYNLWWKNNLSEEAIGLYYNIDEKVGNLKIFNSTSNQTRIIKFKKDYN